MRNDLPKGKPILCLDFDGVLHSYKSGWKGPRNIPDPPVPGAMHSLETYVEHFDVQIYSSRSRYFGGRRAMKCWIRDHLIEYFCHRTDRTWPNDPDCSGQVAYIKAMGLLGQIKFPKEKPPAFLQIDDRAVCFKGVFPSVETIQSFRPWNKAYGK
jgi:hypothetical protein